MEFVHILLTALGSIVFLFILTKIIGNRQMSQLSMFDYINGITIGSIAAEMATASKKDFSKPLFAMAIYGLVSLFISYITCKSIHLRRFFTGKPLILFEEGKLYKKNLESSKLDINEFLTQCRNGGYFDLSNIHRAILETNGKISFIPVASQRPVTPQDLNLSPTQEKTVANVIIDGNIMKKNLKHTGNNEIWLEKQLQLQGIKSVSDVFLATCDSSNKLTVYIKINDKMNRDVYD